MRQRAFGGWPLIQTIKSAAAYLNVEATRADKGLLIAAHADEFAAALAPLDALTQHRVLSVSPGHVTWVLPNPG